MAKRPNIKLKPAGSGCQMVTITGAYADNPIGKVCKVSGGYTYSGPPSPTTRRGPVKTKARAILKVVGSYRRWIGLAPGKLRY